MPEDRARLRKLLLDERGSPRSSRRRCRRTSRRPCRTERRADRRRCPRAQLRTSPSGACSCGARSRACAARVTPMPCSGSSSIVPTTSAAPYFWASGTTDWKRASPSSRLIEFRIDLPWLHFRPSSMTVASVESIMSGTLTIFVTRSRNAFASAASSRSGSWRQTSMIWAPPLTCARAISAAASNWPSAIRRLNLRRAEHVGALADEDRPHVLVDLERLDAGDEDAVVDGRRAAASCPRPRAARAAMCAGVVPQQPPTMFSQPFVRRSAPECRRRSSPASPRSGRPRPGSPAFG